MAVHTYPCPSCKTLLKSPKPLAPGKKVKCPKCSQVITIEGDGKTAKAKPAPVAPKSAKMSKKKDDDDDEDGGGAYTFKQAPADEEEDEPPPLDMLPKERPKTYRGVAIEGVVGPSKFLLIMAAVTILLNLIVMGYFGFPLVFSEHTVKPDDYKLKGQSKSQLMEWKDLTDEQLAEMKEIESADIKQRVILLIVTACTMIYFGFVCYGGVKMRLVESYALGWVAVCMALPYWILVGIGAVVVFLNMFLTSEDLMGLMISLIGVLATAGYLVPCLISALKVIRTLMNPEIKMGFAEEREYLEKGGAQ